MKRKAEVVLGGIGVVIDIVMGIIGVVLILMFGNGIDWMSTSIPTFDAVYTFVHALSQLLWIPIITSVLGAVLGLAGIFSVVGDKRPRLAGIFFVIAAIATSWLFFVFGTIQAALYLIAGIMCFSRSDKEE